jgi:hypothetical protein
MVVPTMFSPIEQLSKEKGSNFLGEKSSLKKERLSCLGKQLFRGEGD